MHRALAAVWLFAALTLCTSLQAHHSTGFYDFKHLITVKGVVKTFVVKNPHMTATITVSTPKGPQDLQLQGNSYSNFYKAGWRGNSVKAGDAISLQYAPRVIGGEGGYIVGFTTASGKSINFKDGAD